MEEETIIPRYVVIERPDVPGVSLRVTHWPTTVEYELVHTDPESVGWFRFDARFDGVPEHVANILSLDGITEEQADQIKLVTHEFISKALKAFMQRDASFLSCEQISEHEWELVAVQIEILRSELKDSTVLDVLRYTLKRVKEGYPIQKSLLYPADEEIFKAALIRFVQGLPSSAGARKLTALPDHVIIESLERAIKGERGL